MWQNRENNYQMPQEEHPFNSSQRTMPSLPIPVPTSSQTTESRARLRCDCVQNLSSQDHGYVISCNLFPTISFSPPITNDPYYQSSRHGNGSMQIGSNAAEAGPSRREYDHEEALRLEITANQNVSEEDVSVIANNARYLERFTSATVQPDVAPPTLEQVTYPVPYLPGVRGAVNMPQPSFAAVQVANRVINYARAIRNARDDDVSCLDCGYYPVCPVTGKCGHTRCARCIEENGKCLCGNEPPESLFVNVLVQDLINKAETSYSAVMPARTNLAIGEYSSAPTATTNVINARVERVREPRRGHGGIRRTRAVRAHFSTPYSNLSRRVPISLQARYNHAVQLVAAQRYLEAAPHLALAAGSSQPGTRSAHTLLAQVITILCKDKDPRRYNRQLNRSVRQILSTSWIKGADMECILCSNTFTNPVTTPCGHMFCRICMERALDYHKRCPLCLRSLQAFNVNAIRDTVFIEAALAAIDAVKVPDPLESDYVPIFLCTVAYPSVPCPLFIFDPRYWMMVRRVLESGSRKFGMLYGDRECGYANIGTLLEVKDCVQFEDGRSILSTVGVSRFRVIEKSIRDGCEVARIKPIIDALPIRHRDIMYLKLMSNAVRMKALIWLMQINTRMIKDIENTFGALPSDDLEGNWWEDADGPAWIWWIVAVLPLQSQIKVLILATDCLMKRMMAVLRTLHTLVSEQPPFVPLSLDSPTAGLD